MAIRNRIRSIAGALIPAIDAAVTAALALKADKSANLSDLASASAARTNLGLGTAATTATTAYATAAQGALADSASQPGHTHSGVYQPADANIVSVPTPAEGDFIQRGPTGWLTKTIEQVKTALGLGTAAYTASTAYASALGADDNYVTDAQKAELHAAATVTGNGIAITGQALSLSIGTGSTQVAAGNHTHSGVYAESSHTHVSADVTDASTGGNGATDSGKLVKFGGEGGGITFAGTNTFGISGTSTNGNGVRASSSTGNALSAVASGNGANYHATFGNSGDDRSFVARLLGAFGWWRGAYSLMVSAVDTLTANRVQRFPDKDGTVALTSDIADHAAATDPHGDRAYADSLVIGLVDDRGNFDASINTFPTTGGSGTAGAILKGDLWTVSVVASSGPLLGYPVGCLVRALTDTPGQTAGNWSILQVGFGYSPENAANKSTSVSTDQASDTKYPSVKSVYDWAVGLFSPKASPTFSGTVTTEGNIELGHASDTTLSRSAAGRLAVEGVNAVLTSSTDTLTNKRVTARVTTITSHATPTVNTDNCDAVTITALAEAITSMTTNLSGTPANFDMLMFRIKDNGTARTITWGASFVARGAALPTTTVAGKLLHVLFIWNSVTSLWGCLSTAQET